MKTDTSPLRRAAIKNFSVKLMNIRHRAPQESNIKDFVDKYNNIIILKI